MLAAAGSRQQSALSTQHSAFSTQHSALSIQHSAFSTQHSALSIQHSAFSTQNKGSSAFARGGLFDSATAKEALAWLRMTARNSG
jgi:hypothetical protein